MQIHRTRRASKNKAIAPSESDTTSRIRSANWPYRVQSFVLFIALACVMVCNSAKSDEDLFGLGKVPPETSVKTIEGALHDAQYSNLFQDETSRDLVRCFVLGMETSHDRRDALIGTQNLPARLERIEQKPQWSSFLQDARVRLRVAEVRFARRLERLWWYSSRDFAEGSAYQALSGRLIWTLGGGRDGFLLYSSSQRQNLDWPTLLTTAGSNNMVRSWLALRSDLKNPRAVGISDDLSVPPIPLGLETNKGRTYLLLPNGRLESFDPKELMKDREQFFLQYDGYIQSSSFGANDRSICLHGMVSNGEEGVVIIGEDDSKKANPTIVTSHISNGMRCHGFPSGRTSDNGGLLNRNSGTSAARKEKPAGFTHILWNQMR